MKQAVDSVITTGRCTSAHSGMVTCSAHAPVTASQGEAKSAGDINLSCRMLSSALEAQTTMKSKHDHVAFAQTRMPHSSRQTCLWWIACSSAH